jgi:hypothetical protein
MDHNRQEERHAAARAFMESLDQLQTTLESEVTQGEQSGRSTHATHPFSAGDRAASVAPPKPKEAGEPGFNGFNSDLFEQAIADIEQFLQPENQQEN